MRAFSLLVSFIILFLQYLISSAFDYEEELISRGIQDLDINEYYYSIKRLALDGSKFVGKLTNVRSSRKEMLCATFVKTTIYTASIVLSNMLFMGKYCDWAVVIYAEGVDEYVDDDSEFCSVSTQGLCRQLLKSPELGKVVHCARAEESLPQRRRKFSIYNMSSPAYNNLSKEDAKVLQRNNKTIRSWQKYRQNVFSIPKTALYKELLPLLPRYRKVFLLDEDILLHNFDVEALSKVWDCAFWPQPPPLIVQPLVRESVQFFTYLNLDFWQRQQRKNKYSSAVLASSVGLIEQQVPLFNSMFFEWFVKRVLALTREKALEMGADWGADRVWCSAANAYALKVLNWTVPEGPAPSRQSPPKKRRKAVWDLMNLNITSCAVIVAAPPISHLDTRSMRMKLDFLQFKYNAFKVVDHYRKLFPNWSITDTFHWLNPGNPRYGRYYRKALGPLNPKCMSLRANSQETQEEAL